MLKRIAGRADVLALTAWQLVLGGLPLFALAAVWERDASVTWTAVSVALVLGLALAGTALPYLVWNGLAREQAIGDPVLWLFLVPVFGVAAAALLFGERPAPRELAGLAFAVAGVALAMRPRMLVTIAGQPERR